MKLALYIGFAVLVLAIVKPRATAPGVLGWFRDFFLFIQTSIRAIVIGMVIIVVLVVIGVLPL